MSGILWAVVAAAVIVAFGFGLLVGRSTSRTRPAESAESSAEHDRSVCATTPTAKPRAGIVVNPSKSGIEEFKATAQAICRQERWEPPLFFDSEPDDPGAAATREALAQRVDLVIAAGGDGTVRAVAETLVNSDTPMGIIPMGTGNLLARNLNLPLDSHEWALRVALWGRDSDIDVAYLRTEPDGEESAFTVMAGIGYDAAVMADTDPEAKDRRGWFAYVEAGSRKLTGQRTRVQIAYDDAPEEDRRVRSVLVGNCGKVQGGVQLIAGAEVDDGKLDVLSVTPKNVAQWIGVVAAVMGRQRKGPHTSVQQCEKVVIRADEEMDVQMDGDPIGTTDYLEVRVDHLALAVRTPTAEQKRKIKADLRPVLLN